MVTPFTIDAGFETRIGLRTWAARILGHPRQSCDGVGHALLGRHEAMCISTGVHDPA